MRITRFILTKVLSALATLLIVSAAVFLAMQMLPGGYAEAVLGPLATPEARAAATARFGLDQPIWQQYLRWLGSALQGNLGTSLITGQPVAYEISLRLPATIQLVIMALVFALAFGIVLGLVSGLTARRPAIRDSTRFAGTLAMSVPDFVIGTLFVYIFSVYSLGLTVGGYVPFADDPSRNMRAMVLPAITLGLFGVAIVMRTLRDSVSSVLTQPFITAAVARGDRPRTITSRHVLRNASSPLITITAVLIGGFLGGTVIAETLFSVPGIGQFFANSVRNRDYATVQAVVLLSATVFIVANMIADISYSLLDPRVRTGSSAGSRK